MLKNHPDAVNDSNIPPISDGWFLTTPREGFEPSNPFGKWISNPPQYQVVPPQH